MSDEFEHAIEQAELAAWDAVKRWQDERALTYDAMFRQNIQYHDRIVDLEIALRIIARKKKMDATAAASMRAIATSALSRSPQETE